MDFSPRDPVILISRTEGISTDDLRGKAIPKGAWNQQEGEIRDRCSKWQLVQVEKRWCLVFSCMYVSPSCSRLPSQGRDLFTTLAVSVFPLYLILEKQICGSWSRNVLTAVCITPRKQKVCEIALCYHRYLPFRHFGSVFVFLFVLKCFHPPMTVAAMLFDLSCYFCKLKKMKVYALCCETWGWLLVDIS